MKIENLFLLYAMLAWHDGDILTVHSLNEGRKSFSSICNFTWHDGDVLTVHILNEDQQSFSSICFVDMA